MTVKCCNSLADNRITKSMSMYVLEIPQWEFALAAIRDEILAANLSRWKKLDVSVN